MWVYVCISKINYGICISVLFYFSKFIINRTKKSFILNLWFIIGFKTFKKQNMELCQQKTCCNRHETWFWNQLHRVWVTSCYGKLLFNLHWCVLFISIFIILTNVDTLVTLYFYVYKWNKIKKTKTRDTINKTFLRITQFMEVAQTLTIILAKNDDLFGYQCNLLYFLK